MLKEHYRFHKTILLSCHRITGLLRQKEPLDIISFNPLLKVRSTTAGCSGLFQSDFEYLQG